MKYFFVFKLIARNILRIACRNSLHIELRRCNIRLSIIFLGKPKNHEDAVAQLTMMSGQVIDSYTSICVYNTETKKQFIIRFFLIHNFK